MADPRHIRFVDPTPSPSGKTSTWRVATLDGIMLGTVKWHGAWRRYVFFPAQDTLFEPTCLTDLAAFLSEATAGHKLSRKSAA